MKYFHIFKLSFTNIQGLCSNFVECESSLESNSSDILGLYEPNLDDSVDSGNFSVRGLSSFNPKGFYYSYAWSCSLCRRRASFCTGLISRELCRFLLMFLTGCTSLSVLLLFPLSTTFFVFIRVQFNDSWFGFNWSFHELYFSRKHILHEPYRVNRTQGYGFKIYKQVPYKMVLVLIIISSLW